MLDAFKRLFQREAEGPHWPEVERWAEGRGLAYRRAREGAGFVLEGQFEGKAWRLEWGPTQRDYIVGHELRLRMDLDLPQQMQLLVLSRELMRAMETETFDRYTDHLKTQIDASTPEEMRWLVMYPKLSLRAVPTLRSSIGACGSSLPALSRWLQGPLAEALEHATLLGLLAHERPFVLMTSRHRVVLRIQQADPELTALDQAIALFEIAAARTPSAVEGLSESSNAWPSTAASAFQSELPNEDSPRR